MKRGSESILALAAAALVVGALLYFLDGNTAQTEHTDGGSVTEAVAAAAGARVLPTDPKLKVEPK